MADAVPEWARWSPAAARTPWSVGVEEEAVLATRDGRVANCVEHVLALLPRERRGHASAETHACVLELKTGAHESVAGVGRELAAARAGLVGVLAPLGLEPVAVGMHPLAQPRTPR